MSGEHHAARRILSILLLDHRVEHFQFLLQSLVVTQI
jgi:hypothetical protein